MDECGVRTTLPAVQVDNANNGVEYTHRGSLKLQTAGAEAVVTFQLIISLLYPYKSPVFRVVSAVAAVGGAATMPLPLAEVACIEARVNLEAPRLDAERPLLAQLAFLCSSFALAVRRPAA